MEIVTADATWKGRCRVSDSLRDMIYSEICKKFIENDGWLVERNDGGERDSQMVILLKYYYE